VKEGSRVEETIKFALSTVCVTAAAWTPDVLKCVNKMPRSFQVPKYANYFNIRQVKFLFFVRIT
jgi:hypothetical protein